MADEDKLTISEKELLKKKLDEEIKMLDIRKQNLITSTHELEVRREADRKVDEVGIQRERNQARKEIANLKNSLISQTQQIEKQKETFADREADVLKREEEVRDAKFWLDKLQDERQKLYNLRKKSEEMMIQAQEKMGEVNAFEESYQAKKDELEALAKVVEDRKIEWNTRIGEVEIREKELKEQEADLRAREKALEPKPREVANV